MQSTREKKEIDCGYTPSDKIVREKSGIGKTYNENSNLGGQKYTDSTSEKIVRKETIVEKAGEAIKLSIDPIAVGKEIGKQFKGINDVLSNTMKQELRQIDCNLDDSQ